MSGEPDADQIEMFSVVIPARNAAHVIAGQLEALASDVRGQIESAVPADTKAAEGIAVAGTPTSLAAIELELVPYDPAQVDGHVLSLPAIQRTLLSVGEV